MTSVSNAVSTGKKLGKGETNTKIVLSWGAVILGWRLLLAAIFPFVTDEAYYVYWSKTLDFGYFDHPPFIAWLAATSQLASGSPFVARLGTIALSMLASWSLFRVTRVLNMTRQQTWAAMLLYHGSLGGLAFASIIAPDAPMLVFWTIALCEAVHALVSDPRRWVTAGAATGLAMLSKYTAVLLLPIFLWTMWRHARGQLRTKWPWLGVAAAGLCFAPNLLWNVQHDFMTMQYQLKHGLSISNRFGETAASLPEPLEFSPDSPEAKLAALLPPVKEEPSRPRRQKSAVEKAGQRLGDFVGGQAILWGFALIPVGLMIWGRRKSRPKDVALTLEAKASAPVASLFQSATLIPLLFFGTISLASPIEANWAAMHLIGGVLWIAASFRIEVSGKGLLTAVGANLVFVVGVILVFYMAPESTVAKRFTREAGGYETMARWISNTSDLPRPIFADRYQLASQLDFYGRDSIHVDQWPGIARPSDITVRAAHSGVNVAKVTKSGSFTIVGEERIPARIPGFVAQSLRMIHICEDGTVLVVEAIPESVDNSCGRQSQRTWFATSYGSTNGS